MLETKIHTHTEPQAKLYLVYSYHLCLLTADGFWPRKLRLTTIGDPLHWPCNTPLSTEVGTKFRWQVVVAQSV
jgi:hypothetical protein